MFTKPTFSTMKKTGSRIFAAIMVLAFLGAALPSGAALAQSGSNCQETYTVKSGDWLVKIAANYTGVAWSDIATANNIKAPNYVIFVGQKLCIPKPGTTGSGSSGSGGITGSTGTGAFISFDLLSGGRIEVSVENARSKAFYFVKLDDTKQSRLEWYKVGTLGTGSDRDAEKIFNLPDDLLKATNFNICLKDTSTDDLLCNNPSMTKLADKNDDDDDDDDDDKFTGTFTVDWEGDDITIETKDFPKDEVFNVRVAELGSGPLDFTVVGKLNVEDDPSDTYTYDLDGDLEDADSIRVCLKNTSSDAVSCVDLN